MNSIFSFRQIRDKFFSLSTREQLLVVLVIGAAIYFFFDALVLTSQSNRRGVLTASHTMADSQIVTLHTDILAVSNSKINLEGLQIENAQLKKQVALLKAILGSLSVSAPEVSDLVRGALKDYPRVTLVALKTIPTTTLIAASQSKKDSPVVTTQKTIYKHGVEVEIRGSYLDLLAYLKNLEVNAKNVFWSDAKLNATKYPETSLRVTIFILSDQPILKIS